MKRSSRTGGGDSEKQEKITRRGMFHSVVAERNSQRMELITCYEDTCGRIDLQGA